MADPTTPHNTTPTDGTTTTTQAGYHAESVRVAPNDGTATTATGTAAHATTGDTAATAAKKGLVVGVLTFLGLWLYEYLTGTNGGADSTTVTDIVVYAIVGVIVGLVVKMIAKR